MDVFSLTIAVTLLCLPSRSAKEFHYVICQLSDKKNPGLLDVHTQKLIKSVVKRELHSQERKMRLFLQEPKPVPAVNQTVLAVNIDSLEVIADTGIFFRID